MHPVAKSALDVRVYQRGYNLVVRCFVDGELVFKDQFGGLVPVTPGRHTIRCETQGRGGYGEASLVVDIAPGMTLPVFYAPPLSYVSKGALALTPQQPRAVPSTGATSPGERASSWFCSPSPSSSPSSAVDLRDSVRRCRDRWPMMGRRRSRLTQRISAQGEASGSP